MLWSYPYWNSCPLEGPLKLYSRWWNPTMAFSKFWRRKARTSSKLIRFGQLFHFVGVLIAFGTYVNDTQLGNTYFVRLPVN